MNEHDFNGILAGLKEAVAIQNGEADPSTYRVHVPARIDVKAIRKRLKLTQQAFADDFALSVGTVRDWEQGRSSPEPSTRILLKVIEKEPEAVRRALKSA